MIFDVPQVMIQTGPNGEDPVIEVPKARADEQSFEPGQSAGC